MAGTEHLPIAPVQATSTPFWSVMIPAYRPTELLRETLESVRDAMQRSRRPWQIEVVDDASPDIGVAALLSSWGLADVPVFRRQTNGGLGECWNTCIDRAAGEWVHILHQDDLVEPAFYARMEAAAEEFPSAGMMFCRTQFIEGDRRRLDSLEQPVAGVIADWLAKISSGQRLQCPSVVVRRESYRRVGRFDADLRYVIDWVMWIRLAAAFDVAYVPEALASYRIHEGAETRRVKSAGITTLDLARGLARIRDVLAEADRLDCMRGAASYAIRASGFATYEAEAAHKPATAAREIVMSLRYLGKFMGPGQWWRQLKWYLRLRAKALRT